jgi:hypothetical protein
MTQLVTFVLKGITAPEVARLRSYAQPVSTNPEPVLMNASHALLDITAQVLILMKT